MGSRVIGMGWLARLVRGDDGGVAVAARRGAAGTTGVGGQRGETSLGFEGAGVEDGKGERWLGRCRQYNRDGRACRGACHQRG